MQTENKLTLIAAKQRIDGQKAQLEAEYQKLEADKESYAARNCEEPIKEINEKLANIKAELAKPYYADREYRQLSIAYMEAVTANYAADLAQNEASIKAAENAVAAANENLAKAREHTEDIKAAVIDKINGVGLGGVIPEAVHCPPDHLISKYKDLCSKYD